MGTDVLVGETVGSAVIVGSGEGELVGSEDGVVLGFVLG